MNNVNLTGRITHDLELKITSNGNKVMDFQIAVQETKDKAEFIRCQAWKQSAEFLNTYAGKGMRIGISGSLKTDRYQDRNGNNVERTYVLANRVEVLDRKPESNTNTSNDVTINPDDLPFY